MAVSHLILGIDRKRKSLYRREENTIEFRDLLTLCLNPLV